MAANGSDGANCSRATPCRTFAATILKTSSDGVITAIGAGNFGPVTIQKPITIVGTPGLAGIYGTSGPLVSIQVSTLERVNLIGLNIDGLGSASTGIQVLSFYDDTVIGQPGSRVVISDCVVANTTGKGIAVIGDREDRVLVRDSLIVNNAVGGLLVEGFLDSKGIVVEGSTFDLNGNYAVRMDGANAVALVSDTSMYRSPNGLTIANGGKATSFGNNRIRNGNPPTATVPLN